MSLGPLRVCFILKEEGYFYNNFCVKILVAPTFETYLKPGLLVSAKIEYPHSSLILPLLEIKNFEHNEKAWQHSKS